MLYSNNYTIVFFCFFFNHKPVSLFGLLKLLNWIFLWQTSQLRSMRFHVQEERMTARQASHSKQKLKIFKTAWTNLDLWAAKTGFFSALEGSTSLAVNPVVSSHSTKTAKKYCSRFTSGSHQFPLTSVKIVSYNLKTWPIKDYCFSRAMKLWLWGTGNWAWGFNRRTIIVDLHIR